MVPEKDTVDAIFNIVKALNQSERKKESWWAWFKRGVSSLTFLGIWLPGILIIVAVGLVFISQLLGPSLILGITIVLMATAACICIYLDFRRLVVNDVREHISRAVNRARQSYLFQTYRRK